MKTKAIVATLFIAAAASADARFAWPYPRKTLSPDEIGYWIVINGNSWRQGAECAKKPNQTWLCPILTHRASKPAQILAER